MKRIHSSTSPAGPASAGSASGSGPALGAGTSESLLAVRLGALAETIHLRILRLLEQEELSVGEVAKVVQLPQSTVSRRLKVLGDAGWLFKRAEGTATFYRLLLDDLTAEARSLWLAVRAQLNSPADPSLAGQLRTDAQRLESVVSERSADSLAYFGRVAGEWDAIRSDFFGADFTARALLALLSPEWTIADLGCGTGNASEHLAPFVKRIFAVDQSAPMLKAAKKRLRAFANVDFVRADLSTLPMDDASVDAATFVLVLHHLESPGDALREAVRILRPGGIALVIDMQEHDRRIYRSALGHRHLGFSPETMLALFEQAGLTGGRVAPLMSAPQGKGPGLFVATARKPVEKRSNPETRGRGRD